MRNLCVVLPYVLMDVAGSRDDEGSMDMVSRDNHRDMDMILNSDNRRIDRAEITAKVRSCTSLIGPGVVGEPLRLDKVLAAAGRRVHIAPLCSSTIHGLAVALHGISGVAEGEAGALAPAVGEGGGSLLVLHHQAGGAKYQGSKNAYFGQHAGFWI